MIDPFVLLTPILLFGVVALLRFVGCNPVFGLDETQPAPQTPPMLSIAFQSISTQYAAPGASVTIPEPSGVLSTDILLAAINTDRDGTVTAPNGWTPINFPHVNQFEPMNVMLQTLFYRVGSGGTSYTFTLAPTTANIVGTILRYSRADTAAPILDSGSQVNAGSTTYTAPSLNPNAPLMMLVAFFGVEIPVPSQTITPQGMMDRSGTLGTGDGLTWGLAVADEVLYQAGVTGARTATGPNARSIGQMVALKGL